MRGKHRGEERNRSEEGRKGGEMRKGNEKRAKKLESNRTVHKLREREMEERLGREAQKGRRAEGRGEEIK